MFFYLLQGVDNLKYREDNSLGAVVVVITW